MAEEAEKVAVEVLAKVDGFDGKIRQSATAFEGGMKRIEQSGAKAEAATGRAMTKVEQSMGRASFASRNLGAQIADVSTQLASGTSPFLILAQQGPQVAQALEGAKGKVGAFASFLTGPWGAAVLGATTLIGLFGSKMLEAGDDSEKLKKKTLSLADALGQVGLSSEETRKALEAYNEAQDDAREGAERMIKVNLANAASKIKDALATREQLAAELARREADLDPANAPVFTDPDQAQSYQAGVLDVISRVRAKISENNKEIATLGKTTRNLLIEDARREAEAAIDPIKRINNKYDDMRDSAEAAAAGNTALAGSLRKTLTEIEKLRKAELDIENDRKRAARTRRTDSGELSPFANPVGDGPITGSFGERRAGRRPGYRHGGIDIAVPVGTPVKAAAAGTVIEAGTLPGFGNVVVIDHGGGTITRYAHLSKISARQGAVAQGQLIGLSGGARGAAGSGNSTGPHLHYEVRQGGRAVDPRKGQYRTDSLGAEAKAAEAAERLANAEAERKQRVANEAATLDEQIIRQKREIAVGAAEQARLEIEAINVAEEAYRARLDALVEEHKRSDGMQGITEADAQLLAAKRGEIADIERQRVERREQQRIRQENLNLATSLLDNDLELLRAEEGLATTQDERRRIALAIVDAEAEKLRLTLENAIKEGEIAGVNSEILDAMRARLANLDTVKANAVKGAKEDTASPLESYIGDIEKTAADLDTAFENIAVGGLKAISDGLVDAIVNFRSLGDVARSVLQQILAQLLQIVIQMLIMKAIKAIFGGGFADGGLVSGGQGAAVPGLTAGGLAGGGAVGFPTGGPVSGPGTATSDSIPAWLSDGEFVIKAKSAAKLGRAALDRMNLTGEIPGFAEGGTLARSFRPVNAPASPAGGHSARVGMDDDFRREMRGVVADAVHAMPSVNLYPTVDPAAALKAALGKPGGRRALLDFFGENRGAIGGMLG